jgi:hypothetical protein
MTVPKAHQYLMCSLPSTTGFGCEEFNISFHQSAADGYGDWIANHPAVKTC